MSTPDQPPSGPTATALPQSDEPVQLDPSDFSADVTNAWFPLAPGTRWTYRETTEDGEVLRVVVTSTSVTREIANGVNARVVRDTVTLGGEIIEDTLDWYAQDSAGTVWYLGEDTAEFENGRSPPAKDPSKPASTAPRPESSCRPPRSGNGLPAGVLRGRGRGQRRSLGARSTRHRARRRLRQLLQTADTTPLEPDVLEHKYYAEGVGLVLTIDRENEGREELLAVTQVPTDEARRAGLVSLGESYRRLTRTAPSRRWWSRPATSSESRLRGWTGCANPRMRDDADNNPTAKVAGTPGIPLVVSIFGAIEVPAAVWG